MYMLKIVIRMLTNAALLITGSEKHLIFSLF